jgi:hypothetical protein
LADFRGAYEEFVSVLESEENKLGASALINNLPTFLAHVRWKTCTTGAFWYCKALASPTALYTMFEQQVEPRFTKEPIPC